MVFPSMALFVSVMAVANESIDSWVSESETYVSTVSYHLLQKIKRKVHPRPLASLKSTMDDSNPSSAILLRITPLQSHLLFLVSFTTTTQDTS